MLGILFSNTAALASMFGLLGTSAMAFAKVGATMIPSLASKEVLSVVLAFLTIFIATGAGVGGGGILVPLYTLVLGVGRDAVPLSNATIFGASIVNMILYGKERHPLAQRPLVDWDLILAMEPMTILGALLGSYLNKIAPTWLTSVCLTTLLALTTNRMIRKAGKVYAREELSLRHQTSYGSFGNLKQKDEVGGWQEEKDVDGKPPSLSRKASSLSVGEVTTWISDDKLNEILREPPTEDDSFPAQTPAVSSDLNNLTELERILQSEARTVPIEKILGILFIFAAVITVTILKGGKQGSPLGFECGSMEYWMVTSMTIPVTVVVSLIVRQHLIWKGMKKDRLSYQYVKGDVTWDTWTTIKYPGICAFAGLFAGLFGVGGGIVKGPLMVEMGILPEVAVATSSTMIFFTTGAATISFLVFGTLPLAHGAAFFSVGIAAALMGQMVLTRMIKELDRPSYIIYGIGIILGFSAVMMTWSSVVSIMSGHGVHGIC